MTETDSEGEFNRYYAKQRLNGARKAEEAGMTSYFKNIYADFLCCGSLEELKTVAGDLAHYKLHQIRPPAAVEHDMELARAGGPSQFERYEALQKELKTSQAYAAGNVFAMLAKLRELYTGLYDELKESATSGEIPS